MKERCALKYPPKKRINLEDGLLNVIQSAYYNKSDKKNHSTINDVNVQIEIRHYLETQNMFDDYSLNPKMMVLAPRAFWGELYTLVSNN